MAGWAPRAQANTCSSGGTTVNAGNLQTAINAIPGVVTGGDYCIFLNAGYYNEIIDIEGKSFSTPNLRIHISSAPGVGKGAVIRLPSGVPTAFRIANDSVTVTGLEIQPNFAVNNAIHITTVGFRTVLSGVTVSDPSGLISQSALRVDANNVTVVNSSFTSTIAGSPTAIFVSGTANGTAISFTTATVNAGTAVDVSGSSTALQEVYAQAGGTDNAFWLHATGNGTGGNISLVRSTGVALGSGPALRMTNAYEAKITSSAFYSVATSSVVAVSNSYRNEFAFVTAAVTGGSGANAFQLSNSTHNVITSSVFNSNSGMALLIDAGSELNLITRSTATSTGASSPTLSLDSSSNTISLSVLKNTGFGGTLIINNGVNFIQTSSITAQTAGATAMRINAAQVQLTDSILSGGGVGLRLDAASTNSLVSKSTVTGEAGGTAVLVTGASATNFATSYFGAHGTLAGIGLRFDSGANNTVVGSTIVSRSANPTDAALRMTSSAANNNLVNNSVVLNNFGTGILIDSGAHHNTIQNTSVRVSTFGLQVPSGPGGAVFFSNTASNTLVGLDVFNSTGSALYSFQSSSLTVLGGVFTSSRANIGEAAVFLEKTHTSLLSGLTANNISKGLALYFFESSSNTITASKFNSQAFNQTAFLSNSAVNQVVNSTVTNIGKGTALELANGGGNSVINSSMTAFGNALVVATEGGDLISGSVMTSNAGTAVFENSSTGSQYTGDKIITNSTQTVEGLALLNSGNPSIVNTLIEALYTANGALKFLNTVNASVSGSTVTSILGPGLVVQTSTGSTITNTQIAGSTGAVVNGAFGFTTFSYSTVAGLSWAGLSVVNAPAASTTTLDYSVVAGSVTVPHAVLVQAGSPASVLRLQGTVAVQGLLKMMSGGFRSQNNDTLLGGDFMLGMNAWIAAFQSTITFNGSFETPPRPAQTFAIEPGSLFSRAFDTLEVKAASFSAAGDSFGALQFRNLQSGTTVAFQTGTTNAFTFTHLQLRGGTGANGRITMSSLLGGVAAKLAVTNSSMTLTHFRDIDASYGPAQFPNDQTSVNAGGNNALGFLPFLHISANGRGFQELVGSTGAPVNQTAGVVTVVVRAFHSGMVTLTQANFPVALGGSDVSDSTMTQTLVNGTTVFQMFLPRGETASPPFIHTLLATSTFADSSIAYTMGMPIVPGALNKLQTILPGETILPGSPTGKLGVPSGAAVNVPYFTVVRGVDQFWNKSLPATDSVHLTTTSANLPLSQSLVAGTTTFAVIFTSSGTNRRLIATDLTNGGITSSTSALFSVFDAAGSSPTVSVTIASGSFQSTLGGYISGTASDPVAVAQVRLQLQRLSDAMYFNFNTGSFSSASPISSVTALSAGNTPATAWTAPILDSALTNDVFYYIVVVSSNPAGNTVSVASQFKFVTGAGQAGSNKDGTGTATVGIFDPNNYALSLSTMCGVAVASITYTAGPQGLDGGGAIAVKLPNTWSPPSSLVASPNPATGIGQLVAGSTTTFGGSLNPTAIGTTTFGSGWIVYFASSPVTPGQKIFLSYTGFVGGAAGPQPFTFLVRGSTAGIFKPISSQPSPTLLPGQARNLIYNEQLPLTLGPLQTSSTMHLLAVDACGNSTNTVTTVNVFMYAKQNGSVNDPGRQYFLSGGTPITPDVTPIPILAGQGKTQNFYFNTATAGPFGEQLSGTAIFNGQLAFAQRFINVTASSISITGVSVDTGTLSPGVVKATVTAGSFSGGAVINFTLSDPQVPWEVIISTSNVTFTPELVHRGGQGQPGRGVVWGGLDERSFPQTLARPGGPYFVKIRAGFGATENTALQVFMATTPFVYGTVNSTGAYAFIQAQGPGANYQNTAVADGTGYFELYGLQAGSRYNIVASTGKVVSGQFVNLQASSNNVTALLTGHNVGAMPFPTTSLLRVRVQMPQPAPHEFWGGLNAVSSDGRQQARGTLHFAQGFDKSDDGFQSFGANSSSWTILNILPGTYNLDIHLNQVGISSRVTTVVAPGTNDLFLALERKANIYGFVTVPSSSPFGSWISVQGLKAGDTRPSVFGGAFLQGSNPGPFQTSGTYQLFGLDPGSWTVTARAFGYGSISSGVFISSNVDVGLPNAGGFNLALASGAVLNGKIEIPGDSTNLPSLNQGGGGGGGGSSQGLTVFVNAFNPGTYSQGFAQVQISTSATLASSTFSITGLEPGTYFINVNIPGASLPQISTNVPSTGGFTTIIAPLNNARALITVKLPTVPAIDTQKVVMYFSGHNAPSRIIQNLALAPGTTVHTTSMTWLSPLMSPGYSMFHALYAKTGAFRSLPLPITNGSPTAATIDLSGSTYTISGTVALGGNVDFETAGGAVSVSSVPGVLQNAAVKTYCLAGRTTALTTTTFHLELMPITRGRYRTEDLLTQGDLGSCAAPNISNQAGNQNSFEVNPLHAYAVDINADGSFAIPNVPPGNYVLRVPRRLSGSSTGNDQLPPVSMQVSVTTSNVSGLTFSITRGTTVSGKVRMPPGLQSSRFMQVTLLDSLGTPVKHVGVNFVDANTVDFLIDRVPDGTFALVARDLGYPRNFGAKPLIVKVAGAPVNQDIQLVQTGVIKGKMAVKQFLANSTTAQFTLITQHNMSQITRSFQLYAEASPWFEGGRVGAFAGQHNSGGFSRPQLDENDQFVIDGVLPGVYEVVFESYNEATDPASLKVLTSRAPGVRVVGNSVTDLGTYNLATSLQVRGRVYNVLTSSPVANISLTASPATTQNRDSNELYATSDASGTYTMVGFDPAVKVYDLYAGRRHDLNSASAAPPFELKIAPSVDITSITVVDFALTPAAFSVSGRVAGTSGGPALIQPFGGSESGKAGTPGANVFFQRVGVPARDNPIADLVVGTDADGTFTIPSLTTGTYKLTAAARGYASTSQTVLISSINVNVGTITLNFGSTLSGSIRKPDGSSPGPREIETIVAVTNDFAQIIPGTLTQDPNTQTFTAYSLAGFQAGVTYRVIIFGHGAKGAAISPSEVRSVVFSTSTESRTQDIVLRPAAPFVFAKSKREAGGTFRVRFELSQALRQKTADDDILQSRLSTFAANGSLSQFDMDPTRTILTALYTPSVSESSFTLKLSGFSTQTDPDSIDPSNGEFVYNSTVAFFKGIDGFYENYMSNFNGGTLLVEDDNGRVTIPGGAFQVDASSSLSIGLALSNESLASAGTNGLQGTAATIGAMRYKGNAYPPEIFRAMAATPPSVSPFSSFYNILLPLGIRTALQKPVPMTISYSTNTDPTTLNLYWYNAAANAYILQQDVTGALPVIDYANHTITINVNHFSTFVMFNTGVAVITGNAFAGEFNAYNFPNPFDLSVKTVNPIHGGGAQTVRGTMISIAVPPDVNGSASIRIFNVAGEKVRTLDLGTRSGGVYLYQAWDGRNDNGGDVASGVYLAQVKIGGKSKFFKMALIK